MSSAGLSSGQGHCVVFLSKTLHSHSASLHSGVYMGTSELNARGNPAMDWHSIQGGVEILLAATCYSHWDKLQPDGPLSFTFTYWQ